MKRRTPKQKSIFLSGINHYPDKVYTVAELEIIKAAVKQAEEDLRYQKLQYDVAYTSITGEVQVNGKTYSPNKLIRVKKDHTANYCKICPKQSGCELFKQGFADMCSRPASFFENVEFTAAGELFKIFDTHTLSEAYYVNKTLSFPKN